MAELEDGSSQMQIVVRGGGGDGGSHRAPRAWSGHPIEGMIIRRRDPCGGGAGRRPPGAGFWVEALPASGAWGERPTDIIHAGGGVTWEAISPEGVRIPPAFGPDGLIAYLTRDEFDVSVVDVGGFTAEWVSGN